MTEPLHQPAAGSMLPEAAMPSDDAPVATVEPDVTRRRGPARHRLRDARGDAWVAWALLIVFAAVPLVSAVHVAAEGWRPTGDVAAITLRATDVGTADTPLVGQPTTSGFYNGGIESSHPGPIEYYLLAGPVRVLGPIVGPVMGAALIVSLTMGLTLWLAYRRGGTLLMALVAGVLAATAFGLGSQSLHDGLDSEISLYPYALLVLTVWSVVLGDTKLLPLTVGVVSFIAQVHVPSASLALPLAVFAGAVLVLKLQRSARRRRRAMPDLLWAAAVAVALWLPVIIDQATGTPGNLTSLYRFVRTIPRGIGTRLAAEHLVTAVGPPPILMKSGGLAFIHILSPIQVIAAFALMGFLGSVAVARALKGERRFPMLVLTLAVLALSEVASTSSVPSSVAVRADAFRWMWIFGALVWAAVAWAILLLVKPRLSKRAARLVPPMLALVAVAFALSSLMSSDLGQEREGPLMPIVGKVSSAIRNAVPPGEYRLISDGSPWQVETGLIVELEHDGYHIRATRGQRALGKHRSIDASSPHPELGEILIRTSPGGPIPDGASLIAALDVAPRGWPAQRYRIYSRSAR